MDETDLVYHLRGVGEHVGHPLARLSVARHGIPATHHHTDVGSALVSEVLDVPRVGFPIKAVEDGFRIKKIHLAGAPVHKKLNHRGRFGRVVPLTPVEIIRRGRGGMGAPAREFRPEELGKSGAEKSVAGAGKKVAAAEGGVLEKFSLHRISRGKRRRQS